MATIPYLPTDDWTKRSQLKPLGNTSIPYAPTPAIITPAATQELKRLEIPGAAPSLSTTPLMKDDGSLQRLPTPVGPSVAPNQILTDTSNLQRLRRSGSGADQILHPVDLQGNPTGEHIGGVRRLGGVLAKIGDVAASTIIPGAAQYIPGTTAHNQQLLAQDEHRQANDLDVEQQKAQTRLLDAQPALKQATLENATLRAQAYGQHQQDQAEHLQNQDDLHLRAQGYKHDVDGKIVPLQYEEMSDQQQGIIDAKKAQKDWTDARAEYEKAKGDPNSFIGQQALARMQHAKELERIAYQKIGLQQQGLQLRREGMDLNEDKFYNPQPTATQRTKGDLAQSALDRITEMREVVNKHPEWFGPVAGRVTNAAVAIGSQNPDMQKYLSAAQYLSDHSAGVFGGRGKYITEQLHGITDPHSNPAALQAALDEAQRSAEGFVSAGRIHGRGASSGYTSGSSGAQQKSYKTTATSPNGHKIGSNDGGNTWFDMQTGKAVQ